MSGLSYEARKASRLAAAGPPERAYAEMRRALELFLEGCPPETGRFVQVVTDEERLREALSQRVGPRAVLDVMEQRWPYPAQRRHLVRQITQAVGSAELLAVMDGIDVRYGLVRPAQTPPAAPVVDPSSLSGQPSVSTEPSLPARPAYPPPARVQPAPVAGVPERREIAVSTLSDLSRSQCRSLAYGLRLTVGRVDDIDRSSLNNSEAVRRTLEAYFETPLLHRGDQFGTLIRALRDLHLNMTADRLTENLQW